MADNSAKNKVLSAEAYRSYLKKQDEDMRALANGTDFSHSGLRSGSFNASLQHRAVSKQTGRAAFQELGFTGLSEYSGFVLEEFLPELRHSHDAYRVYREMSDNDATIGAMLYVIEQLIQNASRQVVEGDERSRFLVESALDDMSASWMFVLNEILSMLIYGYSYMEVTLKKREGDNRDPGKRSKHNDGLIGWRKIALRGQNSTWRWILDEHGGIRGMEQQPENRQQTVFLPIEKSLLFRVKAPKNSPQGRSILRNAYRSWIFKRRFEEIEGIATERELTGLPVLISPEGYNLWNPNDTDASKLLTRAEDIVRNIRIDQHQGVVLPFGWELKLLSSAGTRSIDTTQIINRLDQRIAVTVLADMLLIGQDRVGSFALVAAKTTLFSHALQSIAKAVADVFNRHAIPRLLRANGLPANKPPKLLFGPVQTPDLKALAEYINKLVDKQVIVPDDALEDYLRQVASFPKMDPDTARTVEPPEGGGEGEEETEPREPEEESEGDDSLPTPEDLGFE